MFHVLLDVKKQVLCYNNGKMSQWHCSVTLLSMRRAMAKWPSIQSKLFLVSVALSD